MDLEEFEIDGKKVYISNKSTEGETGVAYFVEDDNIEKTQEIKVLNEEDINKIKEFIESVKDKFKEL